MYVYIYSGYLLVWLFKNFRLVSRGFGKIKEICYETRDVKSGNRNTLIATQRKVQVSHLLVIVFLWKYFNTSTRKQPQKVHTHLEADPDLRQGIWGPFFP